MYEYTAHGVHFSAIPMYTGLELSAWGWVINYKALP